MDSGAAAGAPGQPPPHLPRSAAIFLVIDAAGAVLLAMQAMQGLGLVASHSVLHAALRALWPLTIANMMYRLALQTELWDTHRRAISNKECHALKSAARCSTLRLLNAAQLEGAAVSRQPKLPLRALGLLLCLLRLV